MMYEKLFFNITFGTEKEKNTQDPCAEILLDKKIIVPKQTIINDQTVMFDIELHTEGKHELVIERTNHDEKNKQILSIKKFTVDDIDLNKILDEMYYYPKYPALWHKQQTDSGINWPEKQKGWRSWGFNGRWIMEFESPFYTWLLKNT